MKSVLKKLFFALLLISIVRVITILAGLVTYIPVLDPFLYGIRNLLVQLGGTVATILAPLFRF